MDGDRTGTGGGATRRSPSRRSARSWPAWCTPPPLATTRVTPCCVWMFALCAAAQVLCGVVVAIRPAQTPCSSLGLVINGGAVLVWALTRTVGIPIVDSLAEVEAVGRQDLGAAAFAGAERAGTLRRPPPAGAATAAPVSWVGGLAAFALVAALPAHSAEHGTTTSTPATGTARTHGHGETAAAHGHGEDGHDHDDDEAGDDHGHAEGEEHAEGEGRRTATTRRRPRRRSPPRRPRRRRRLTATGERMTLATGPVPTRTLRGRAAPPAPRPTPMILIRTRTIRRPAPAPHRPGRPR